MEEAQEQLNRDLTKIALEEDLVELTSEKEFVRSIKKREIDMIMQIEKTQNAPVAEMCDLAWKEWLNKK